MRFLECWGLSHPLASPAHYNAAKFVYICSSTSQPFVFISFHFIIFIQGKYSNHKNVDLQTALSQKKSYKVTVKIGTIRYVKVKGR